MAEMMEPTRREKLEWLDVWYELFELMTETFAHSRPGPKASEIYSERLGDIPADRLRAAVEQCLATCRFFPTIADLREAAGLVGEERFPTPIEGWEEVCRAIRARAMNMPFAWTNPIAEKVAAAMDLRTLSRSENPATDRAHFLTAYREQVAGELAEAKIAPKAREALPAPERKALPTPQAPRAPRYILAACASCARREGVPEPLLAARPYPTCRACGRAELVPVDLAVGGAA